MIPPLGQFIWSQNEEELSKLLNTDLNEGLTEEAVQQRLETHGTNELPTQPPNFLKIYLAPLFNWLIVIYLIAAIVMFIFGLITGEGNMTMILITLAVVALNCVVAIFQQARATKKLKALKELAAPTTLVIRGGQKQEILTKNLVPGDLLVLDRGSRIPADCRIVKASNLKINEASLTGESEPVRKNGGEPLESRPLHLQNQTNILFFGTYVVTGNCTAVIYATGADTEIGKISQGLEEGNDSEIPIRKKLNNIGKWLGIGVITAWAVVLIILYIATGNVEIIKSLNSAMDIMPINIPLLTTIVMLTGTLAMAEHGVIIRNLTSVDSLGRVSVVCTDKTGTLTKSQMCVQHIWTRGSRFQVSGSGYAPEGEIVLMDNPHQPVTISKDKISDYPHLDLLLRSSYLNNNASLIKHEFEVGRRVLSDWKVLGNPTEGALLSLAKKAGYPTIPPKDIENSSKSDKAKKTTLDQLYLFEREYPFSSSLKRMTKVFRTPEDKFIILTKGASEILVSNCEYLLAENNSTVPFIDELRMIIMNTINEYAKLGYRILSFAYKMMDSLPSESSQKKPKLKLDKTPLNLDAPEIRAQMESDLIYIGFVAIMDPPREGVKEAIFQCKQAGVDVIMITGDSLPTAKAIANQIGLDVQSPTALCEGNKLDEFAECGDISHVKVFARVSPSHKQKIVETYQKEDKIVAMTGDGVNDALALNDADVGIAMGIQGTDVAKEASDMIISDDSFLSIVEGIKRGRGIFTNIRSVVFFFIAINLFEGIVQFLLAVILNRPYFLDESFYFQWIFLSLTVHMFPGLMLTFDRISEDVMKERPRDSQEIISKPFLALMLAYGVFLALAMLTVYFVGMSGIFSRSGYVNFSNLNRFYLFTPETQSLWGDLDFTVAKTLTMLMAILFLCETALALQIRRPNKSLWRSWKEDRTPLIIIIISALFGIFLILLYVPGLQLGLMNLGLNFNFVALGLLDWLVCLGIAFGLCIVPFELVKAVCRSKGIQF